MKRTLLVLMMACLAAFLSVGVVGCGGGGGGNTNPAPDLSEDGTVVETEEYTAGEEAIGSEAAAPAEDSAPAAEQ